MRKVKTVAIVGAGITGMTAAYFEALKGNFVYLIEMDDRPGGLLKSEHNEFGSFDYGTHVGTKLGEKELDDFLFSGMTKKDFEFFNPGESGNYYAGKLSSKSPFVNTEHLEREVINQANIDLLSSGNDTTPENLEEAMIARYGLTIYEQIFKNLLQKFMGPNAAKLSPEVLYFFDMNRLLAFDSTVTDRLKTIACYDEVLGFHYPCPGRQKIYPKVGGISFWIDFLMAKLEKAGVKFLAGTRVNAITNVDGSITHINTGKKEIKIDKLIWTIPAALFSRLANPSTVLPKPKFRKTGLYNFSFKKPLNSKCYYINIYDESLLSARMTLYQNLTNSNKYYSCTIEVLQDDDFDFESSVDKILAEIYTMNLADENNECVYKGMIPINNGFPILDFDYIKNTNDLLNSLKASFNNVTFLGRGNGGFFMRDVLKHTYQSIVIDELAYKEKRRLKIIP